MRPVADTKARIESCALRLFVERGFLATSMRDIAACVGVTEGALYRHFIGKEQLAWQLFSTGYTDLARLLDRLQAAAPALPDKLDAMLDAFVTLFDSDPLRFNYLLLAQHGQLNKVTADMPNPVEVVRRVLADAMERGELARGNPDFLAALVMGLVLQPATFIVYGRLERPLGGRTADIRRACRRILNLPAA
jgi:AcrR family transcriptional regulator